MYLELFHCLLFFRPIKLELIYNLNNSIRKKTYTETYINPDRQTDRDLIVFCLKFKISLWLLFFLCLKFSFAQGWGLRQSGLCISRTRKGLTSSFFLGRPFNKLVVFNCICKKNWFCSLQKEKFLSLCSISNRALIIIQWVSQCLPSPKSPGFLNCCSLPGSSKEVISHNASLLLSPQVSLTVAPFLGAPKRLSVTVPPFSSAPRFP